ncbi:lipoprotein insertase outer membrane protein LolB [Salinimonas chungwhensis]|uniref:lipoprotein insertase outer membrane protein LolB n=1 Tax=Salinimonas chungwhensis TaxID=265425 RepID=UPI000366E0A2|nr:lipoprotein insertase outer membrane protein LolB [Salinimonas chungwhensis]
MAACTTLPDGPEKSVDLPAQLAALEEINTWKASGKMAIRQNQEAMSANLNWRYDQPDFQFRLTNLLGITLVDLKYTAGHAVLKADDKVFENTDPKQVIEAVTGWQLPVERLLDWIKGLPGPTDQYQLNEKQLLQSLSPGKCEGCGAWTVSYANYGQVGDVWLPHALTLTNTQQANTFIKIRIDKWTL